MKRPRAVVVALRIFALFQRVLSSRYRRRHGRDALNLFDDLVREAHAAGGAVRVGRVTVVAVADLIRSAPGTWLQPAAPGQAGQAVRRRTSLVEAAELRPALRNLGRRPLFALVIVMTLALATGVTTSVVAIADAALFRPLPYEDGGGIFNLVTYYSGRRAGAQVSYLDFMDIRRDAGTLAGTALYRQFTPTLTGDGEPKIENGLLVTSDFFSLLRLRPAAGRFFSRVEDAHGHADVVVLSWGLWQSRFGGDPDVVGSTIRLSGEPVTVVGVGPRQFPDALPAIGDVSVFRPFGYDGMSEDDLPSRGNESFSALARLKPGVTTVQADAELERVTAAIEKAYPRSNLGQRARVEPVREEAVASVRPALLIFLAAVFVVLVIAVTNVVSLMLARASDRRRELALRAALGAGRGQLSFLLIVESMILSLAGGAAGWGLAVGLTRTIVARAGQTLPLAGLVRLDYRILILTALVSIAAGLTTGLVVAFHSTRGDLNRSLIDAGGRGVIGSGSRLRRSLVIAQVALCVVLIVAAGLLVRSLDRVMRVDPGFDTRIITFGLVAMPASYPDAAAMNGYYDRVLERIRAIPGVETAATVGFPPMNGESVCGTLYAEQDPHRFDGQDECAEVRPISPDYFHVMSIPLLEGRAFTSADDSGSVRVGIVSESTAKLLWPGEDAIGKRFTTGLGGRLHEVVGVVADVKQFRLDEATPPQTYLPDPQWPNRGRYVVLRATIPPAAAYAALRAAVWAVDDAVPIRSLGTLEDNVRRTLVGSRFRTLLLVSVAGLALLLAVIGLYGVIAGAVVRRRGEMAIRMSLGARPLRVLRMVLADGGRLVGAGAILGVIAALAASRLLSSLLFDVSPTDPATFALAPALVFAVAIAAILLPAVRATRVNPAETLRLD